MFTQIGHYQLYSLGEVENDALRSGIVKFKSKKFTSLADIIKNHPYCCFVPKEFRHYSQWLFENDNHKEFAGHFHDYTDDDKPLVNILFPIEHLIKQFVFVRLRLPRGPENEVFFVAENFDSAEIFRYWFSNNHFADLNQWRRFGIGEKIFNFLPSNCNYYDRNIICTCGQAECRSLEVWYVKYRNSYCITFIKDYHTIPFDLHYFDSDGEWKDEDYTEDDRQYEDNRQFPFCFETKNFKLFDRTIFPNQSVMREYSKDFQNP